MPGGAPTVLGSSSVGDSSQADLRHISLTATFTGRRGVKIERTAVVAQQVVQRCGACTYLGDQSVRWLGDGTWFLNVQDVRGIGGPGMEGLHECGWLLLMLISNAYLYKFPTGGRYRARRALV